MPLCKWATDKPPTSWDYFFYFCILLIETTKTDPQTSSRLTFLSSKGTILALEFNDDSHLSSADADFSGPFQWFSMVIYFIYLTKYTKAQNASQWLVLFNNRRVTKTAQNLG